MKHIKSCIKTKEWILFAVFVAFMVFQIMLTLRLPEYTKQITMVIESGQGLHALVKPGLFMMLSALGSVACAIVAGFCISRIAAVLCMRLREALFGKVMSFSMAEMSTFSASSLITRCTNDISRIQFFATIGIQVLVQGPVTAIIAILKMRQHHEWLIVTLETVAVIIVIHIIIIRIILPRSAKLQKLIDKMNLATREHITGMRVVHAYNGYDYQAKQFDQINDDLTKTNLKISRTTEMVSPILTMANSVLSLLIYVIGAFMITSAGDAAEKLGVFSDLVVVSSYAMQAVMAFILMMLVFMEIPRAIVSVNRIAEVLDTEVSIQDGNYSGKATGELGTIEFRNVSFTYPRGAKAALSDVSFKVEKGQTMAIIGSTGSGKTTLMNLIPRLYDATEGSILVDGVDVKDYKLDELRSKLGYVPQKSFLFAGTIAGNINYGERKGFQAVLEDIQEAAEVGQSKEFIESKKGSYQARVEEGGANFSGGQRQRLTISRAICRNPEFYMFDDSFSALDFKTDAVLRRKLREHAKEATQLIVGQRIGSIKHADMILVLDQGHVVGQGRHEDLLKNCAVYREIALSQLSEEEVG
ncbi:MAG: ABC transporter ATP-binding protein [Blautia sp.]|nr:ABC transporter ATP-binding protein [Blautia sp.]